MVKFLHLDKLSSFLQLTPDQGPKELSFSAKNNRSFFSKLVASTPPSVMFLLPSEYCDCFLAVSVFCLAAVFLFGIEIIRNKLRNCCNEQSNRRQANRVGLYYGVYKLVAFWKICHIFSRNFYTICHAACACDNPPAPQLEAYEEQRGVMEREQMKLAERFVRDSRARRSLRRSSSHITGLVLT